MGIFTRKFIVRNKHKFILKYDAEMTEKDWYALYIFDEINKNSRIFKEEKSQSSNY